MMGRGCGGAWLGWGVTVVGRGHGGVLQWWGVAMALRWGGGGGGGGGGTYKSVWSGMNKVV